MLGIGVGFTPVKGDAGAGDAVPHLHVGIWRYPGLIDMGPYVDRFEEGFGAGSERAGPVGILIWGKGPGGCGG